MGNVLRVAVNGRVLNLARQPMTTLPNPKMHLYSRPATIKMTPRNTERNGKVKVYTKGEIRRYQKELQNKEVEL